MDQRGIAAKDQRGCAASSYAVAQGGSLRKMKQGVRRSTVCLDAAMASLFLFSASISAHASTIHPNASGGGCSAFYSGKGGYFNVCIGSPSDGVARADIYVHWTGNHSGCRAVDVWDSSSDG